MNNTKKAVLIYGNLTKKQQKKLENDFTIYGKSIEPMIKKLTNMLESGYYIGSKKSWIIKIRKRYLNKNDFSNYVLKNGYSYNSL